MRTEFWRLAALGLGIGLFLAACGEQESDTDSEAASDDIAVEDIVEEPKPVVELFAFDCGTYKMGDISPFAPSQDLKGEMTLKVPCYLIRHEKGMMIWDAGLPDSFAESPETNEKFKSQSWVTTKFADQLAAMGINPEDIDYIALSHLHYDHSGNANMFTKSTWLVQQADLDAAKGDNKDKINYAHDYYSVLLDGKIQTLNGDHDVFGDGRVVIISTPGHTPGHQSLFLKLDQTGPLVLSGDLWHFRKIRDIKGVPSWNYDKDITLQSMEKMETFLKDNKAGLWIQHDPSHFDAFPHAPNPIQ